VFLHRGRVARIVLHLHGDSFARRYQVASHAITACAAGDQVLVVLWFDALQRHVRGGFDDPLPGEDRRVSERHVGLGLPPPAQMLAEARALGARLVACETAVRLAGLDPLEVRRFVDDLPGLQELLAEARQAQLVLYV
jgi:peroxiredoxin family protein